MGKNWPTRQNLPIIYSIANLSNDFLTKLLGVSEYASKGPD